MRYSASSAWVSKVIMERIGGSERFLGEIPLGV